jgi:hypothetical protein
MRKRQEQPRIPATDSGPKPADFPLGSVESRAAVRAMINRRAAKDQRPDIYQASWVTAGHSHEPSYIILDINTGLPVNGDTTANGMRSAAVVQQDEELLDAATEALPAQIGESDVAPRKKTEEQFEILDP